MKIPIYQVDAFTAKLFGGNPAAVCPLEKWLDESIMQNIAAENNLSETAFFIKKGKDYELKWFTPEVEINLCGHATLASAHVLFNHLGCKEEIIKFQTRSGELSASKSGDLISLDFPASKPSQVSEPRGLSEALGRNPVSVFKSRDIMALLENEEGVLSVKPDFKRLISIDAHAIIITAPGEKCDFVSRFFAPRQGINEDPVTGSAHTTLIPFWAERLKKKKLHAMQLSKRTGELFCEHLGERVLISGRAVTYMTGEIDM